MGLGNLEKLPPSFCSGPLQVLFSPECSPYGSFRNINSLERPGFGGPGSGLAQGRLTSVTSVWGQRGLALLRTLMDF